MGDRIEIGGSKKGVGVKPQKKWTERVKFKHSVRESWQRKVKRN